ncbi:MAG TPA: class I SAM-dependent methyltransferase [Cellulomonas sp.]
MTAPAGPRTVQHCPACRSDAVRVGPQSHRTGLVVARCRTCGAQFLVDDNPADVTEVIGTDEVSVEYVNTWVDHKREGVGPRAWHDVLAALVRETDTGQRPPRLYDVGAGGGEFLAVARDEYGFEVSGNDIMEGAVTVARERSGIELDLGDLAQLDHEDDYDAVTMWCVLAHVPDGEQLLREVHRMLVPGGVLYLQTPHNTVPDRSLLAARTLTRGRATRLSDRRLAGNGHHRILHTPRSMTRLLERAGFTDARVVPQARYSMSSVAYLRSLRAPEPVLRPAAWLMDRAIASPLAPRITLDVWARKPR